MKTFIFLLCLLTSSVVNVHAMTAKDHKRIAITRKGATLGFVYRKCSECDPERYRIEDAEYNPIALLHIHVSPDPMKNPHVWFKFFDEQKEHLARKIVERWNPFLKQEVRSFKPLERFIAQVKQRDTVTQ